MAILSIENRVAILSMLGWYKIGVTLDGGSPHEVLPKFCEETEDAHQIWNNPNLFKRYNLGEVDTRLGEVSIRLFILK